MAEDIRLWFSMLDVGDEVALEYSGMGAGTYAIRKVKNITPKGRARLEDCDALFRSDGWEVTVGYHRRRILPVSDDIRRAIQKQKMIRWLTSRKWADDSFEVVKVAFSAANQRLFWEEEQAQKQKWSSNVSTKSQRK